MSQLSPLKKMKRSNTFFGRLLSSKDELSSRRFIALCCLPILLIGAAIGIMSNIFEFYLVGMLSVFVPVMIAYFFLTWQNIAEIVKSIKYKNEDSETEISTIAPNSETTIPDNPEV